MRLQPPFNEIHSYLWFIDSRVRSALPPPRNLRPKIGPMKIVSDRPFLLTRNDVDVGAQFVGPVEVLHTTSQLTSVQLYLEGVVIIQNHYKSLKALNGSSL